MMHLLSQTKQNDPYPPNSPHTRAQTAGTPPMEGQSNFLAAKRVAVVTGANKGIGLEICRQLVAKGVTVVLTARDEKKGLGAVENIRLSTGSSGNVIFHQLDVTDPSSIASLATFVNTQFGKLDILVNNAAIIGMKVNADVSTIQAGEFINWDEISTQTYDLAEECLRTNYYGAKMMIETFIPLLQLSDSPRIVNVSSSSGKLKFVGNACAKAALSNTDSITEEIVDAILNEFLNDLKEGHLETKGWPSCLSAYTLSKAAMNAYTRILSKKYANLMINSICPGYVKTDIHYHTGVLSVEEGAESPVWLALLPKEGSSGMFFSRKDVSPF